MSTVKKLPTSENGPGVVCVTKTGRKFQITQNLTTGKHTLWSVSPTGGFEKITTGDSPHELYSKINWDK